jgi:hypothetical protein
MPERNPWLKVDFGESVLVVQEVHVVHRMDCCVEQFHDAAVLLLLSKQRIPTMRGYLRGSCSNVGEEGLQMWGNKYGHFRTKVGVEK